MTRYSAFTDQQLTTLLKEGDRDAFMEIYHRYKKILYKHGYKWLQDSEEVKDVIQDLFTTVWSKKEQLLPDYNLSGYLYTSMRNLMIRKISRGKLQSEYLDSIADFERSGESQTDYRVRESQLRNLIEKEISALPEKMQEIFRLSRTEHLSHAEIAERLGISEMTVKTQVKRAIKVLRGKLGLILYMYMIFFY